ncbi:tetratricopeptide repeat protein [Lacinutrix sp. C3R15]|uniref:tetratricopeptide repeat protein n=1 Tax=Flavobacteriaceae TaxID=49546 RepID=UPI001C082C2A|nr:MULTISPECIES: tetratricopeptide repeat protein [Flavobacteriaceae]MBU2938915.1 tetratricopeptide repeat protein [Lacinutrix sp. C3R15]MDO6622228.1 tetratricopeptide repeat protein [Oceanihabitans sp. 1_MG-2023]
MIKKRILFIFVFVLTVCGYAQELNSTTTQNIEILQQQLKNAKQDTVKIRILNNLSSAYALKSKYEDAEETSKKALLLANKLLSNPEIKNNTAFIFKCKTLKAKALNNFGAATFFKKSNAALDSLQTALKIYKEINNKAGVANTFSIIAEVYSTKGDLVKSLNNYKKSIALLEEINDESQLGMILYNKGLIHRYMLNYGDAMESNIKALQLGKKLKDTTLITQTLLGNGFNYMLVGQFEEAIENQEKALKIFVQQKDSIGIATTYNDMGVTDLFANKLDDALINHTLALDIRKKIGDATDICISYTYISNTLEKLGNYPEALQNSKEALKYAKLNNDVRYMHGVYRDIGYINIKLNDFENALKNFNLALELGKKIENKNYQAISYLGLGKVLLKKGKTKEGILQLNKAIAVTDSTDYQTLNKAYEELTQAYAKINDYKNAYNSQLKFELIKDAVHTAEKTEKITNLTQSLIFENKRALQKASQDKQLSLQKAEIKRQKLVRNITVGVLVLTVVFAFMFFLRFTEKRKLNIALQTSIDELKTTQKQLIQSEKMASLGELTAGIAHEIQNPLNFVNNFSEVSTELIEEMHQELDKGDLEEVKAISNDIKLNLEKINHHGKRADDIVKGMLQHSRNNSGEKEQVDLNKLTDEYLRLAYHGLRAKDKSFNAILQTDFDPNLGKITVVSQEIGRVILNLFTNAFYAVNEKKTHSASKNYKPTVSVKTLRTNESLKIIIKDNGNGIPNNILDKIFQPFFTTKPTGKGTGLGLSMSYDIVKSHGGTIEIKTENGSYTEFTILLPIKTKKA